MRRLMTVSVLLGALAFGARGIHAQGDGGYKLVPNWPKLPAGMYFGLKEAPPPPAEREPQAAARRARGGAPASAPAAAGRSMAPGQGPTNQPGISGLAIDAQDHIYVVNRGEKPVMVFNTPGDHIFSGADQEINCKKITPSWQHSGGVDWDGNVY